MNMMMMMVVVVSCCCCCVWNTASWRDHLRNCDGIELASDLESKILLVSYESRFKSGIEFVTESVVLVKVPETRKVSFEL